MTITERRIGDVTLLELKGRLVFYDGAPLLRAHINELVDQVPRVERRACDRIANSHVPQLVDVQAWHPPPQPVISIGKGLLLSR